MSGHECLDCGHRWGDAPMITLPTSSGDSIAAQVREWWNWTDELTNRGWTLTKRSNGDTYWTRPGKDPRAGHSAVLHGDDCLVVFTTEIPDSWRRAGVRTSDGSGFTFSPFGFLAAAEYDGDRSACARALREAQKRHPAATPLTATNGAPAGTQGPIQVNERHRLTMREQLLSVEQLRNMPAMQPIVTGLIDLDSVVIAYGSRGAAKSFLGIDLAASIASGTMWHGYPVTQGPALYVVAEGAAGFGVRYDAWQAAHYGERLPAEQLLHLPIPINLLSPTQVAEFAAMAVELGSKFIVLDTLARCMVGGDENAARDAGMAVEQLDELRRQTGACVYVTHHAGKVATAGARGSSAFEAAADTVLEVGLTDNVVTITCTKQKNHAEPAPIRLRLVPEGVSAVLADYLGGGAGVSKSAIKALVALSEISTTGGESASVWRLSSEMAESSFYRARQELITLALVSNVGTEKQPRYQVTPSGALILPDHSHTPNESSPNHSHQSHTPIGVGVGSETDSNTTTDPVDNPPSSLNFEDVF